MEILLRIEVPARRGSASTTPIDVAVEVEPTHRVADLVAALTAGPVSAAGLSLVRSADGRVLDPEATIEEVGLVSGECCRLVRAIEDRRAPGPSSGAGDRAKGEREAGLLVTSGPDVCRWVELVDSLGRSSDEALEAGVRVGRDASCDLTLSDPNVARVHLVVEPSIGDHGAITVRRAPETDRPLLVNGVTTNGRVVVGPGDVLRIGATTLAVIARGGPDPVARGASFDVVPGAGRWVGQVPFHRTPYYPAPVEERVFEAMGDVPERPEPPRFAYLAALAPLVLGLGLAFLYSPRMLVFAIFSPVIAVAGFIESRRRNKARFGNSEERYQRRLEARRAEIAEALSTERQRRFVGAPDLATLARRAEARTVDLWIRDRQAPDFLRLRAGLGDVRPSLRVDPETRGDEALRDELDRDRVELETIDDVPLAVDLVADPILGLVGAVAETSGLAASLVLQAACLHSPEDLVVVAALDPARAMAGWLKWLPHVRSASSPLAEGHLAETTEQADRLLRELLAVAETRMADGDRSVDRRWPRLLVVIDRRLEPDATVVSRLLDCGPPAGIAVIWLTASHDRVPRQAEVVVSCWPLLGGGRSLIAATDPTVADHRLEIERVDSATAEVIARSLAPIRDASSTTSATALPRLVPLQRALDTETIDRHWVLDRWRGGRRHALPAPLGLAVGGPFVVDLVEHGPHALIGGTSGSGKSELLMSMVAGLVAFNPPTSVNLLFVDYKGGASSELFADLPHTVGYVTNLDAALANRALISLRAELNRRMGLLQGRAKDLAELIERDPELAPPSLVIVVDEFATLIKEVPEFVAGIVDIAQRGRSLGIHLVLATQRPSGAVNENILANTNLRISLRMLDGTESNSVIGTTDAALIPPPLKGRAFARCGPGELVAFQSAWSGAPLLSAEGPPPVSVSPFTAAGRRGRIDRDDRAAVTVPVPLGPSGDGPATQVDRLLEAVTAASAHLGLGRGLSPWQDELPTKLELAEVQGSARLATVADGEGEPDCGGEVGWRLVVGLVDDPEGQRQYPAEIDLAAGGGLVIFGTGGSGKTTALQTIAASAAIADGAAGGGNLTVFGIDFASRRLASLAALPHCAMVATGDDLESVTRVIAVLDEALDQRRAELAAAATAGAQRPTFDRVLLLIDDYGNLTQAFEGVGATTALHGWLEALNRVVIDGRQVGIHTALTATRRAVVKAALLSAISNRIVLRLADAGGYAELGLRSTLAADADLPPGRGFLDGSLTVQLATTPQDLAALDRDPPRSPTSSHHTGAAVTPIVGSVAPLLDRPPLPAEVDASRLDGGSEPLVAVLGLGDLQPEPVMVDLSLNDLVVCGDPRSGRTTALTTVGQQLSDSGVPLAAIGPVSSPLQQLPVDAGSVFGSAAEVGRGLERLVDVIDGATATTRPVVLIDDIDLIEDPALDIPLAKLCSLGMRWVAATMSLRGYSTNPLVQEMKKARSFLYLQPPGPREVQEVTGCLPAIRPGLAMPPGRGVLVVNRQAKVVQVARFGSRSGHPG